jgi:hypothetical protein
VPIWLLDSEDIPLEYLHEAELYLSQRRDLQGAALVCSTLYAVNGKDVSPYKILGIEDESAGDENVAAAMLWANYGRSSTR